LTFHLLRKSDDLTSNLGLGSFNTSYIGEITLETKQVITLTGVPSKSMGESETQYFEKVSKQYLFEVLKRQNSVDILTVEVTGQFLRIEESRALRNSGRLLQSTATSVEITTIVTGKHQPPPEVDFPVLVSDALNEGNEDFIEKIKVPPPSESGTDEQAELSYFQHVKSALASSVPMSSPSPSPTVEETNSLIKPEKGKTEPNSNSTFNTIGISFGVIGGVIIFIFVVYWMKTRTNYMKVLNKLSGTSTQEEDFSDDKHSRFLYRSKKQPSPAELFESLKIRQDDIDTKIYSIDEEYSDEYLSRISTRGKTNAKKDGKSSCDHNDSNRTCSTVDIENERSNGSLNLDDFEKSRRSSSRRNKSGTNDIRQSLKSSRSTKPLNEKSRDSNVREENPLQKSAGNRDRKYNGFRSNNGRPNSSSNRSRYQESGSLDGSCRRGNDP